MPTTKPSKLSSDQRDFLKKYILPQGTKAPAPKNAPQRDYTKEYQQFLDRQKAVSAALAKLGQLSRAPDVLEFIETTTEEIRLSDPAAALKKELQGTLGKDAKEQVRKDTKDETDILSDALATLAGIEAGIAIKKKEVEEKIDKGRKEDAFLLYIASSKEYKDQKTDQKKAAYVEEKRKRYIEYQRKRDDILAKFNALPESGVTRDDILNTDPVKKGKPYAAGDFKKAIEVDLAKLEKKLDEKTGQLFGQSGGKQFSEQAKKIGELLEKIKESAARPEFKDANDAILRSKDAPASKLTKLTDLAGELAAFAAQWKEFHTLYYVRTTKLAGVTAEFMATSGQKKTFTGLTLQFQECYKAAHDAKMKGDALPKALQYLKEIGAGMSIMTDEFVEGMKKKREDQFSAYAKLYDEKNALLARHIKNLIWHEKNLAIMTKVQELVRSMKYPEAMKQLELITEPTGENSKPQHYTKLMADQKTKRDEFLKGVDIGQPETKEVVKKQGKPQGSQPGSTPDESTGDGDDDAEKIEKALAALKQLNDEKSKKLASRKNLKLEDVQAAIEEERKYAETLAALKLLREKRSPNLTTKENLPLADLQAALKEEEELAEALKPLAQLNYKRARELAAKPDLTLEAIKTALDGEKKENASLSDDEKKKSEKPKKDNLEVLRKEIEKYLETLPSLKVSMLERTKELGEYYVSSPGKQASDGAYAGLLALRENLVGLFDKYKKLEAFITGHFDKPDEDKKTLKTKTGKLNTVAELDAYLDTYEQTMRDKFDKLENNIKWLTEFNQKYKDAEAKLSSCGKDSGVMAWIREKTGGKAPAYLDDLLGRLKALQTSAKTDAKKSLDQLNDLVREIDAVAAEPSKLLEAEAVIRRNEIEAEQNKQQWELDEKEYNRIYDAAAKAGADAPDLKTMGRMKEHAESAKDKKDFITALQQLSQAMEYGRRLAQNPMAAVLRTSRKSIEESTNRFRVAVENYKTAVAEVIAAVNTEGKNDAALAENSKKAITRLGVIMNCFDAPTEALHNLQPLMSDDKLKDTPSAERPARVKELREQGLALVRQCEALLNGHPTIRQFALCPLPGPGHNIERSMTGLAGTLNQLYGNLLICAK